MTQEVTRKWNTRSALSPRAADTLWERLATRILELEDEGKTKVPRAKIWADLHSQHPELYPEEPPAFYQLIFSKDEFKAYLEERRKEHLFFTVPVRLQVKKYYERILDLAGPAIVKRLEENPEDISSKDLAALVSEASTQLQKVNHEVQEAGKVLGGGNTVNIAVMLDGMSFEKQTAVLKEAHRMAGQIIDAEDSDAG